MLHTDIAKDAICKMKQFASTFGNSLQPEEVFMGYHTDVPADIILNQGQDLEHINNAKNLLLACATPDAIARLKVTKLSPKEQADIFDHYHNDRGHDSLSEFIQSLCQDQSVAQVTTASPLITRTGCEKLAKRLALQKKDITTTYLEELETEKQFADVVQNFLKTDSTQKILLVQMQVTTERDQKLVECARYTVHRERAEERSPSGQIIFILRLANVSGGYFHGWAPHPWLNIHINELRVHESRLLDLAALRNKNIEDIIKGRHVNMKILLKEIAPIAISKTDGRVTDRLRQFDRIIDSDEAGLQVFSHILLDKISEWIVARQMDPTNEWVTQKAPNSVHLKEGNTFERAMFLEMRNSFADNLAKLINKLDHDHEFCLLKANNWQMEVMKAITEIITEEDLSIGKQFSGRRHDSFEGQFPLSRHIVNILEELSSSGPEANLVATFAAHRMGQVINGFFESKDALEAFAHDVCIIVINCEPANESTRKMTENLLHLSKKEAMQNENEEDVLVFPAHVLMAAKNNEFFLRTTDEAYRTLLQFRQLKEAEETEIFRGDNLQWQALQLSMKVVEDLFPSGNVIKESTDYQQWELSKTQMINLTGQLCAKIKRLQITEGEKRTMESINHLTTALLIGSSFCSTVLMKLKHSEDKDKLARNLPLLKILLSRHHLEKEKGFEKFLDFLTSVKRDADKIASDR